MGPAKLGGTEMHWPKRYLRIGRDQLYRNPWRKSGRQQQPSVYPPPKWQQTAWTMTMTGCNSRPTGRTTPSLPADRGIGLAIAQALLARRAGAALLIAQDARATRFPQQLNCRPVLPARRVLLVTVDVADKPPSTRRCCGTGCQQGNRHFGQPTPGVAESAPFTKHVSPERFAPD